MNALKQSMYLVFFIASVSSSKLHAGPYVDAALCMATFGISNQPTMAKASQKPNGIAELRRFNAALDKNPELKAIWTELEKAGWMITAEKKSIRQSIFAKRVPIFFNELLTDAEIREAIYLATNAEDAKDFEIKLLKFSNYSPEDLRAWVEISALTQTLQDLRYINENPGNKYEQLLNSFSNPRFDGFSHRPMFYSISLPSLKDQADIIYTAQHGAEYVRDTLATQRYLPTIESHLNGLGFLSFRQRAAKYNKPETTQTDKSMTPEAVLEFIDLNQYELKNMDLNFLFTYLVHFERYDGSQATPLVFPTTRLNDAYIDIQAVKEFLIRSSKPMLSFTVPSTVAAILTLHRLDQETGSTYLLSTLFELMAKGALDEHGLFITSTLAIKATHRAISVSKTQTGDYQRPAYAVRTLIEIASSPKVMPAFVKAPFISKLLEEIIDMSKDESEKIQPDSFQLLQLIAAHIGHQILNNENSDNAPDLRAQKILISTWAKTAVDYFIALNLPDFAEFLTSEIRRSNEVLPESMRFTRVF